MEKTFITQFKIQVSKILKFIVRQKFWGWRGRFELHCTLNCVLFIKYHNWRAFFSLPGVLIIQHNLSVICEKFQILLHIKVYVLQIYHDICITINQLHRGGPGSRPGQRMLGFELDKVWLGQVSFRVLRLFPVSIIPLWLPILIYTIWGMNSRSVGGRSSEILSHPIDMNNNKSSYCVEKPRWEEVNEFWYVWIHCGYNLINLTG
jgi:hypothetical protein